MFKFECSCCERTNEGISTLDTITQFIILMFLKRSVKRCELTSDTSIIDNELFVVRGCVEIPIKGERSQRASRWANRRFEKTARNLEC